MSGPPVGLTALILAGSRGGGDPVAAHAGVAEKCLTPVAGVPMLSRVVAALNASPSIQRIAIALTDPATAERLGPDLRDLTHVACAATPSLTVLAALDQLAPAQPLLVTTADHPLLTPEIVETFIRAARDADADVAAGMVADHVVIARFPDAKRTFWRFQDGGYTGANLFYLATADAQKAVGFWRRVELERKRPWRIIHAFGWRPLLAYVLGRLTLEGAMARASSVIGARIAAIILPFAHAAIDVDKPADLELVEQILKTCPIDVSR